MGALAAQKEKSSATTGKDGVQHDRPLRMEKLDTDVPPNSIAIEATTKAISSKEDNSYLPFIGQIGLRRAAAAHVSRMTGDVMQ